MKLFRIANTSSSWWVFADDLEEAYDIFMDSTATRKRHNLRCIGEKDCPDNFLKGIGVKRVSTHSVNDIMDMMQNGPVIETEADRHESKYKGWMADGQPQPYSPDHDWLE